MALNLLQKDTLITAPEMQGRARQAVREYARYLKDIGNQASEAQHNWAVQVLDNQRSAAIALALLPELVTDAKFADGGVDGTSVVDADFKAAVEAICLKYV